ncbi:serine hydrolase [Rhizorhabdus wittichii DC-6]|uniref:Beta-lactamase n=2 Tax=Rhizorhabdus wittichii TaxID=160791 RepID=A0A9J9LGD9_RHIWR|nr:serine hydrolase domain-containing protein [Rhizorhabdus wittichii]ABQ71043.1 beta-lactamase [Rhizorhabdus wittichii RW1]ARR52244.1 serine hydrolase [Rhizorhabdus wittichii DC-6]QTH23475.1 beta-lactamase family protein [Rhizorhabdus wittichii]
MNPDPAPKPAPKPAATPDRGPPREPHVPTVVQIEHGLVIAGVVLVAVLIAFIAAGGFYLRRVAQDVPKPGAERLSVDLSRIGISKAGPRRIDYARLDRRMRLLAEKKSVVGVAIVTIENGEISFAKGYGVTTDGAEGKPVDAHTVFRWASVSKGVAATLLAKMAEEKKLSLRDPVSRWAPSLKLPENAQDVATIDNLLSQSLGIWKNAYDRDLEDGHDPKEIRSRLNQIPLLCPPGKCYSYQNIAYDAASEAAEHAGHKSYAALVQQELFGPLGMQSATTTREGLESSPSWARPHTGRRELKVADAYYRTPAAGGVNSSIIDLGIWMRAQMGGAPRVLSKRVLREIHSPRIRTFSIHRQRELDQSLKEASYGLGWRIWHYQGRQVIGHRGAVDGYRSLILFDPLLKAGVGMLWNSTAVEPTGMQLEVMDMLYNLPFKDWMELDK